MEKRSGIRRCLWTVGSIVGLTLMFNSNSFALTCDSAAYVWVNASTNTVGEAGGASSQLTFETDANHGVTLTLQISGTATNGVDYQTLPTQVTIPPASFGPYRTTVAVTPIPDAVAEATETLTATITGVNKSCFLIGYPGSQSISIVDGIAPPPPPPPPPVPAPVALTVTSLGTGFGSVLSSPSGILCFVACSANFDYGTNVLLTPETPFPGTMFLEWGGACTGPGSCLVNMNAAKNVTATFMYSGSDYSYDYVQLAYVAYYGRPADPRGQAYWAGRMDAEGQLLAAIINAFGYSDEFNFRYGGLSPEQLVTKIYQQALGRDPDIPGLNWYVAELNAGRRTLQTITLDVLNGATTAPDLTVVENKLNVAAYYTANVAAGCPYPEADGFSDAFTILASVTASPATVTAAMAAIDARCGP